MGDTFLDRLYCLFAGPCYPTGREARPTTVGNTLLGNMALQRRTREIRCRSSQATPSPGRRGISHTNCLSAMKGEVLGPGWCGLAMPGTSPFMASMAPTGHAKNAGSAAKSCTGCLIPTWRAIYQHTNICFTCSCHCFHHLTGASPTCWLLCRPLARTWHLCTGRFLGGDVLTVVGRGCLHRAGVAWGMLPLWGTSPIGVKSAHTATAGRPQGLRP